MQVQEDVAEHAQRTAARRVFVLDAENRTVQLGLFRFLQGGNVFLALLLDQRLDLGDVV